MFRKQLHHCAHSHSLRQQKQLPTKYPIAVSLVMVTQFKFPSLLFQQRLLLVVKVLRHSAADTQVAELNSSAAAAFSIEAKCLSLMCLDLGAC